MYGVVHRASQHDVDVGGMCLELWTCDPLFWKTGGWAGRRIQIATLFPDSDHYKLEVLIVMRFKLVSGLNHLKL